MRHTSILGLICLSIINVFTTVFAAEAQDVGTLITSTNNPSFDLRWILFYICIVLGILIYCAMFYSLIKFHRTKKKTNPLASQKFKKDVFWTLIPCILLLIMLIPTAKLMINRITNTHIPHAQTNIEAPLASKNVLLKS